YVINLMKIPFSIICQLFLISIICISANANEIEKEFVAAGLIDVSIIDSTIQVDLVNSDPKKNFFRENYYSGLSKAYLQKSVALKLAEAQKNLKNNHPSYSLQILDAARPRTVSKAMYDKMKGTKFEKFVANPTKGSMHNYGIAVDITIVNGEGKELDMGISPFRKSTVGLYWEYAMIKIGKKLSKEQKQNRELLSETMKKAGFLPLSFEWWHFDGMEKEIARKIYKIIE
ncbi:MAG: M15 family metallopeptidase, partial [Pseudomonadota bacterium]